MTDNAWSHEPDGDHPALDGRWCSECHEHRSEYAGGKCPACLGHEPKSWQPKPKPSSTEARSDLCSPSDRLPSSNTTSSDTTPTDDNAASTGTPSAEADTTTQSTLLSIARHRMSL